MSSQTPEALTRAETHLSHRGFSGHNPFASRQRPGASLLNALLATALFRCWHILLFFAGWSTLISVLNHNGHNLNIQPTLLTVIGTVIGFVISYRTTSSFERYNEGRRLWSQIILASRTFARTTWFHVPDLVLDLDLKMVTAEESEKMRARSMVVKKSVINLLEAFAVSLKHYLRGEDGIYYQDLYYLVKFLPAYALPAGVPSMADYPGELPPPDPEKTSPRVTGLGKPPSEGHGSFLYQRTQQPVSELLPVPVTTPSLPRKTQFLQPTLKRPIHANPREKVILPRDDECDLYPASMPPKNRIFDLIPVWKEIKNEKAARTRARMFNRAVSHNIPMEISLYLSSYIAALQNRKQADASTINTLLIALSQLVDGLTGLEQILTTPIPFSYSIHLWAVTAIYCLTLPFQIWIALGWITIPGTVVASFIFFGFLVAGEEIENPFGYDKNDLKLDHFTNNIIRNELRAITSASPPDPDRWAFAPENDLIFSPTVDRDGERPTPDEWVKRGCYRMQKSMSMV